LFESEFESNLFALRKDKLRQIADLGQQPYPNQFLTTHTLAEVRQQFGDISPEVLDAQRTVVKVAGRIMAIRAQGKAGFAQLQQGGERLPLENRAFSSTSCWTWETISASPAMSSAPGPASSPSM
jgi:lysyl-tRNA synthetase class 2